LIHFYKRRMADIAARVLAAAAAEEKEYASITVDKPIELELDLGNILAVDDNQTDQSKLADSDEREDYLLELARDNTQILVNAIWNLPTERVEEVVVAKFPAPAFKLPREKPLPAPKQLTKWEKYAKEKGIVKKKKKDRVVWDDVVKKWVPQFGYKKKQAEDEKNWVIPIKEGPDPVLNPHEKLEEDKKERKAKNELQRLRNIGRQKKVKIPTVGVVNSTGKGGAKQVGFSDELKGAAEYAKASTASLGKFQPNLKKQLEATSKVAGKKRKFEPNTGNQATEKERNLGILDAITNKKAKLDITSAVGKQIHQENVERNEEKRTSQGKGGSRKGKGKRTTFTPAKGRKGDKKKRKGK